MKAKALWDGYLNYFVDMADLGPVPPTPLSTKSAGQRYQAHLLTPLRNGRSFPITGIRTSHKRVTQACGVLDPWAVVELHADSINLPE